MWLRLFVVAVGVLCSGSLAASAQKASPLAACVNAADAAKDNPTGFKCDWRAVVKSAPGAALTGRYAARRIGTRGTLTILETGDGPARVGLMTVQKISGQTCTGSLKGARAASDALVTRTDAAPSCQVSIVSYGRNEVRVTSTQCRSLCGARADFDGIYRLQQ